MLSRRRFLSATLGLPVAALAAPTFARAQSPSTVTTVDPTLHDYLALTPTSVANLTQSIPFFAGNQQVQAETLAIALPFDLANDDQTHEWIVGMFNVTLPSFIQTNVFRDDFLAITGFDITQIQSGAEAGVPPNMVTFLRGSFDPVAVQAVQLLNGYQQLAIAGRPVFSLFAEPEIDLTNAISAMALSRMNNSTILDDGTLVYAASLELIEQVLTPQSTLLDQPGVLPALATLDTPLISSAVLGPGDFLPSTPLETLVPSSQDEIAAVMEALREHVASQEATPVVLAAIAGDSPGGPIQFETRDAASIASQPDSLTKFALAYATPEDAQLAATQIEARLATGSSAMTQDPWSELFSDWSAVPNLEQSSVLLSIKWNGRAGRALNLVFSRDLGFITG